MPESVKVALFGNRVLADEVKFNEVILEWVSPNSNGWYPYTGRKRQTHREEGHMKTEAAWSDVATSPGRL